MGAGEVIFAFIFLPSVLGVVLGYRSSVEDWKRQFQIGAALLGIGMGLLKYLITSGAASFAGAAWFCAPLFMIGSILLFRGVGMSWRMSKNAKQQKSNTH